MNHHRGLNANVTSSSPSPGRHWGTRDAATFSVVEGRDPSRYNRSNMGSEKYRLKWSKYESNILSAFHSLLETEALSDVTLFCEGQTFKAHRLVLAACSTHFETLFNQSMPVNAPLNNQLFVILDGTRADDLQILLQFMYRGEAYLHQDRINSVLRTAEVLQVKGLSEGPKSLEINEKHSSGASNAAARPWSPPLESAAAAASPHRSSVGIMGHMMKPHRKEPRDLHVHHGHPHRDLDGSPPPQLHMPTMRPPRSLSPNDHGLAAGFAYPRGGGGGGAGGSGGGGGGDAFSVYGNAFRGLPPFSRQDPCSSTAFSPSRGPGTASGGEGPSRGEVLKNSSPPPPRGYVERPATQPPPVTKEERDDLYGDHGVRGGGGTRSASVSVDRRTPASDKDRHTPASHTSHASHGAPHDLDQRSSRNSPPSPVATPGSVTSLGKSAPAVFASDSTTDLVARYKEERMRRASDPNNDPEGGPDRQKFQDYRSSREELVRVRSPSGGRNTDARMASDDEASSQAASNLEAFRNIAQAHADRERFLQGAAGVLHSGINAATLAAQGLTGSASDYMRMALPVRDTDNGDPISGSGTKLRCPFCERTYGYETNLRAHIRQRHQGIRVSCPYCPRTFTRNNTVRRHVAREHRNFGGRIPTKFGSTRVMPDPIRFAAAAAAAAQEARTTVPTALPVVTVGATNTAAGGEPSPSGPP